MQTDVRQYLSKDRLWEVTLLPWISLVKCHMIENLKSASSLVP